MPRIKISPEARLINQEIGQRIKKWRMYRKLSQTRIAHELGISFNQITLYEKGKGDLTVSKLCQIAEILKIPVSELVPESQDIDQLPNNIIELIQLIRNKKIDVDILITNLKEEE